MRPHPEDMGTLTPAHLGRWLNVIATTEEHEIDCDSLFEVIDRVVELAQAGQDIRLLLPEIALHLDHCPDCRDLYETLEALSREPR